MASKKYAYYNKGNKVAIVEQSPSTSSGRLAVAHCTISGNTTKDTCEAAGGQWIPGSSGSLESYGKYISPTNSVTKGLEIEYAYASTYNIQSTGNEGGDVHRFIAWGSNGTNLVLYTYGVTTQTDLSSIFEVDDWVYIEGSGRWSGLHQVKTAGSANGIVILKTRCDIRSSYLLTVVDFVAKTSNAAGKLLGEATANNLDIERFKDSHGNKTVPYIFIQNAADTYNNGVFEVSLSDTSGEIDFVNKITIDADGDYTSTGEAVVAGTGDTLTISNVNYEQFTVHENVDVLQDEDFDIDITRKQALALTYYLKARSAEDGNDLKAREYFMKLFHKEIEEAASSRKYGPRLIQGFSEMIR